MDDKQVFKLNTHSQLQNKIAKLNSGQTSLSPLQQSIVSNFNAGNDLSDFVIENRTIQAFIPLIDIVVQNDIGSRILKFKINRYFDNVDLSEKDIQVNYINILKQSGSTACTLDAVEDDYFIFSWKIDGGTTVSTGKINYAIEFYETDLENEKIYIWQTKPSSFNVEESIIVLNDAIPTDYTREKTFYDENNGILQYLEIRDTNSPIQIDNRTILTGTLKYIVVANDNVSQIVSFKINRYFDEIDLATKLISIKYINAAGRSDRTSAVNVKLSSLEIEFGWLIDSKFTEKDGIGVVAIEFLGYDENNNFYVWQTKPVNFPIERGLFVDSLIEEPDPSWLQSLNLSIVQLQTGKADLINGRIPDYQLPIGYGGDADLVHLAERLSNLENQVESKAQTIYADNYLLFPNLGEEKDIYIDKENNDTYRWDNTALKYYKIGSDYNNIGIIYGGNANG